MLPTRGDGYLLLEDEENKSIPRNISQVQSQHKSDISSSSHIPGYENWTLAQDTAAPWTRNLETSSLYTQQWPLRQTATVDESKGRSNSMASIEPFTLSTVSPLSDRDLAPSTNSSSILQHFHYPMASDPTELNPSPNYTTRSSYAGHNAYFDAIPSSSGLPMSYQYTAPLYTDIPNTSYRVTSTAITSSIDIPQAAAEFHAIQDDLAQPRIHREEFRTLIYPGSTVAASFVPDPTVQECIESTIPYEVKSRYKSQSDGEKESLQQIKPKIKTTTSKKARSSTTLVRKTKAEPLSRQTSCWRCRRYKKPCSGSGSVCDACVTSGFRIWSTDIGCRKGDMSEFILMLIPPELDKNSIVIKDSYPKPPSFRQSAQIYRSGTLIPVSALNGDMWDQFLYKVQSTGIHGAGVLELLQVAIRHQRKLEKPDKVLVWAAQAMSIAAEIFRSLVATKEDDMYIPTADLTKMFLQARKVLSAAAGQFLRNCLTGRIKQWFTTLLASNINVFAYVLIGDAIAALPMQCKKELWPDIRKTLLEMRQVLYPTARDLLNALSKGSQPLNMSCWETVQIATSPGQPPKLIRNVEGMRLVDQCEATFDGMHELQIWRQQFSYLLHGDHWMSTQPLAVDLLLISSVSRMYIPPKA